MNAGVAGRERRPPAQPGTSDAVGKEAEEPSAVEKEAFFEDSFPFAEEAADTEEAVEAAKIGDAEEERSAGLSLRDMEAIREEILARPEAPEPLRRTAFAAPSIRLEDREHATRRAVHLISFSDQMHSLLAGLLAGVMTWFACLAFASLVFGANHAVDMFPQALSMALLGAVLVGLATAFDSTMPVLIAGPEAATVVAIWGLASSLDLHMAGRYNPAQIQATIMAGVGLAGVVSGFTLYVVGRARRASWGRYIPYQVFNGLMVGAGLLLILGAIRLGQATNPCLSDLASLYDISGCLAWAPGVLAGLLLFVLLWRLATPLPFLLALLGLCLLAWLGVPRFIEPLFPSAGNDWMMPFFEPHAFWEQYNLDFFIDIQWSELLVQFPTYLALAVLLGCASVFKYVEMETRQGVGADLNREYRALGLGNFLAGLAMGLPGTVSLHRTFAVHRSGARGRLTGIVAALVAGAGLFGGGYLILYIPRLLPPALLVFYGLWTVSRAIGDMRKARTHGWEYASLFAIALAMLAWGVPVGVGVAGVLGLLSLVVRSGQVNPLRYVFSGSEYHSKVERSQAQLNLLRQQGEKIYILRLQGFLFLGAFQTVLAEIRKRMAREDVLPLSHVILDFSRVSGMDSSLVFSLLQLRQTARENGFTLVLTSLPLENEQMLEQAGLRFDEGYVSRTFVDLDYAMEWCEQRILDASGWRSEETRSMRELLEEYFPGPKAASRLLRCLERVRVKGGSYVIRQGEASNSMYFIESGTVSVRMAMEDGSIIRLRKLGAGSSFGEMGIYTSGPRSASVVAEEDCILHRFSRKTLKVLLKQDPRLLMQLDRYIINHLSSRIRETNSMLREFH